ncbi:MAG: hypothetical protein HYY16_06130 [Planctomycetes bacterium]|nr:hypothetical protein [Planctomycetota bacterium]
MTSIATLLWIAAQLDFELVGEHPSARTQTTAEGRRLQGALGYDNHVYWGYGDWTENTGPIRIYGLDPLTGTFAEEFTASTENLSVFRILSDGVLYALHTDPRGSSDVFLSRKMGGTWAGLRLGQSVYHAFDIVEFQGKTYVVGSAPPYDAMVWEIAEDGRGVLVHRQPNGYRYYLAGVLNGKLYVTGTGPWTSSEYVSSVFDGSAWAAGPRMTPAGGVPWKAGAFAGNLVYLAGPTGQRSSLYVFDGTTATRLDRPDVTDYAIRGEELLLLFYDGRVEKTRDLQQWETVSTSGPAGSTCMAVLDDRLYVGTEDSKVYRSTSNAFPPATTPAGAGGGSGRCGALGLEVLVLLALVNRLKRLVL